MRRIVIGLTVLSLVIAGAVSASSKATHLTHLFRVQVYAPGAGHQPRLLDVVAAADDAPGAQALVESYYPVSPAATRSFGLKRGERGAAVEVLVP